MELHGSILLYRVLKIKKGETMNVSPFLIHIELITL